MRNIIALSVLIFSLTACTTTYVKRTDGTNVFEASNTSIGWERKGFDANLVKNAEGIAVGIKIDESSGKDGFDRAVVGLENALKILKGTGK